ncbi:DUF2726 domain-containing protein [Kozakia baliensis]|uniref:Uncharacterized protein n=1 Tax=Kozakia baliensis TaxID=153496 RepID=A0A1D8UYC2_9PROT|nr:DUF2726 domain-containing protein [Kozakia baliensis]AOX18619.1 hypothetical protein A0U89_15010 [Kozakia baliensis]GEL65814.1 hypothetical protein KBA01_31000 [Kozakia baliensis]
MHYLTGGLPLIAVLVALFAVTAFLLSRTAAESACYRARPLLSEWERRVLSELRHQLPAHLHLCPQVRLGDAFRTTGGGKERQSAFWRIASKSADFMLVDLRNGHILLGIELNDRTHRRPDRQRRDALVALAFEQAGIPLLCVSPFQPIDITPYLR